MISPKTYRAECLRANMLLAAKVADAWARGLFTETPSRALASRGWDIDAPTALAYEEYGLDVCHNATENRLEYTDTNDDVVALDLRNGTLIRL